MSLVAVTSAVRSPVSFVSTAVALGAAHLGVVSGVSALLRTCGAPAHVADTDAETGLESGRDTHIS